MIGKVPRVAYGGDYNPEQWPEAVWLEDVRLMREAGVTLVSVGVFAWSRLQPTADTWDFGWLDRAMDLLRAHDIDVDLATATASPPPWFSLRHPESLPVDEAGTRLSIGSRQHICPSSTAFAAAATELVERLAERYGRHPALTMWHIGNEYGDHVEQCFCDRSAAHFRAWLQERYGSVDALNEAWHTDVWSGRFSDWAEVMPPRKAPGPIRPALRLDYRRFSTAALLACFERERDILRRVTPDVPVTTNFMRPSAGVDQWRFASREDLVSCDIYPDPLDPSADFDAAFTNDLMRSLGDGRPWLVMEQAMSGVDWRPVNLPVDPAITRRRSLQAVGAGADGIMFFQWRGSPGGSEMLHSSMLPPGGAQSPHWDFTVRLGADIAKLAEVAGSRCVPAEVAMLVDWESWWALEQDGHPSDRLDFRDMALAMYRPFRSASVPVDVRHPEQDLAGYRLVLAPNLFLMSPEAVDNLTAFAHEGGVVMVGPFSGIVGPNYETAGGSHPAQLRGLLGITVDEWWPIPSGELGAALDDGTRLRVRVWREAISLTDAEVVGTFIDAPLAARPALTRNVVGRGQAWYLGTIPDAAGMEAVVARLWSAANITSHPDLPPGVELRQRRLGDRRWLFIVNRTDGPVDVRSGVEEATDLLTGRTVRGLVSLEPQGVAVLRVNGPPTW